MTSSYDEFPVWFGSGPPLSSNIVGGCGKELRLCYYLILQGKGKLGNES